MCLVKTHMLPKISRKPIQVYKIFGHDITSSVLVTPYQKQVCQVGETIKAEHSWLKGIFKNKIGAEGVHAFRTKNMALVLSKCYLNGFVYLCEIPPFTPYWIGIRSDIASSKITIKRKVI